MIGVPGIFAMTGVLVLAAMVVVWRIVPDVPRSTRRAARRARSREFLDGARATRSSRA